MKCCIKSCQNSTAKTKISKPHVAYHRFPLTENRIKWIEAIGEDVNKFIEGNKRICSEHFEPIFVIGAKRLTINAVPTLHMNEKKDELEQKHFVDVEQLEDDDLPDEQLSYGEDNAELKVVDFDNDEFLNNTLNFELGSKLVQNNSPELDGISIISLDEKTLPSKTKVSLKDALATETTDPIILTLIKAVKKQANTKKCLHQKMRRNNKKMIELEQAVKDQERVITNYKKIFAEYDEELF